MYREMFQIFHGLRFIFILQWTKDMKDTMDPMNPKNTWVQWTPTPPNSSPLKIALPTSFGDPCDLSIIISWSDRQEPVPMLRKAKSKPKISSGDPWDLSINSWFDPLEFPRLRMRKNRTSFLCDPWNANILWCEDPENINQNAKTHFGFDPPGQAQCKQRSRRVMRRKNLLKVEFWIEVLQSIFWPSHLCAKIPFTHWDYHPISIKMPLKYWIKKLMTWKHTILKVQFLSKK